TLACLTFQTRGGVRAIERFCETILGLLHRGSIRQEIGLAKRAARKRANIYGQIGTAPTAVRPPHEARHTTNARLWTKNAIAQPKAANQKEGSSDGDGTDHEEHPDRAEGPCAENFVDSPHDGGATKKHKRDQNRASRQAQSIRKVIELV